MTEETDNESEPDEQADEQNPSEAPQRDSEEMEEQEEPMDLSEMEADEISVEELEQQEWTLGGETKEVIEFRGMKFLVEDPDDEAVLNMMAEAEMGEGDVSDRMFKLCRSAIKAPELTPERWREMNMSGRVGLTIRVGDAIGLNDMMDFPDNGPSPQQAEQLT